MSYYDESDKTENIKRDLDYKHTPDSVREDAKRELERRGESGTSKYGSYGNDRPGKKC